MMLRIGAGAVIRIRAGGVSAHAGIYAGLGAQTYCGLGTSSTPGALAALAGTGRSHLVSGLGCSLGRRVDLGCSIGQERLLGLLRLLVIAGCCSLLVLLFLVCLGCCLRRGIQAAMGAMWQITAKGGARIQIAIQRAPLSADASSRAYGTFHRAAQPQLRAGRQRQAKNRRK